jgi:hypothetical protein
MSARGECSADAWDFIRADFLRPERPYFASCYARLQRAAKDNGWTIPSAATLARRLKALPQELRWPRAGRPSSAIPAHLHPLVKRFYELLAADGRQQYVVCQKAGLQASTISNWRKNSPHAQTLEAALNVIGYRLEIVPIAETQALGDAA